MSQLLTTWLHRLLHIGVRRRVALRRGTLTVTVDSRGSALLLATMLLFAMVWAYGGYHGAHPAFRVGDAVMGAFFGMGWGLVAGTVLLFMWRDPLVRILLPLTIANATILGLAGYLCAQFLAPAFGNVDLAAQLVSLGIVDALIAAVLISRWASGRSARHHWLRPVAVFGFFFLMGVQWSYWIVLESGAVWMILWGATWGCLNGMLGLIAMQPFLVSRRRSRKSFPTGLATSLRFPAR